MTQIYEPPESICTFGDAHHNGYKHLLIVQIKLFVRSRLKSHDHLMLCHQTVAAFVYYGSKDKITAVDAAFSAGSGRLVHTRFFNCGSTEPEPNKSTRDRLNRAQRCRRPGWSITWHLAERSRGRVPEKPVGLLFTVPVARRGWSSCWTAGLGTDLFS